MRRASISHPLSLGYGSEASLSLSARPSFAAPMQSGSGGDDAPTRREDVPRVSELVVPEPTRPAIIGGIATDVILTRLRSDDRDALGILHDALYDSLWRLGALLTHSAEAAEEIAQEAFLSVWIRRATLDVHMDIRLYLNEAVRHLL